MYLYWTDLYKTESDIVSGDAHEALLTAKEGRGNAVGNEMVE